MRGLLLGVPAHRCLEQRGVLTCWRWDAVLKRWSREHASAFLRPRDLLAAPFLLRRRRMRRVLPWGCTPWSQGAFLGRRWQRHLLIRASCTGWRARQRERWHRRAPCGADELDEAGELVLVEVVDGAVVQELTR